MLEHKYLSKKKAELVAIKFIGTKRGLEDTGDGIWDISTGLISLSIFNLIVGDNIIEERLRTIVQISVEGHIIKSYYLCPDTLEIIQEQERS